MSMEEGAEGSKVALFLHSNDLAYDCPSPPPDMLMKATINNTHQYLSNNRRLEKTGCSLKMVGHAA